MKGVSGDVFIKCEWWWVVKDVSGGGFKGVS